MGDAGRLTDGRKRQVAAFRHHPPMPVDDRLHGLAARYVASPQWVKTLAGGAYSMLPAALRHGPAYNRFKRIFTADRPDPAYIAERLRETLRAALLGAPAFAEHRALAQGLDEAPYEVLRALPHTNKEDIKRRLDDYLNHRHGERSRLRMFTGGSTAIPMTFYVQRGVARAKEWAAFNAMGERFGTEGQGVVLALRGRTVSTAGRGRVWMYEPVKRHLILSSDHLEPKFMPEYVDALRRWRPRHIHAFPSALFPLIVWLRANNQAALLSQVSSVVLTSESVFEHHMRAFRAFFDCPVMATYGHTERVLLANTLPDDPRYHFWPHYGHLELLGADGQPVTQPGEVGEIVGTSFDNPVMPFVRYRTGDYAALGAQPHATAPGFPVLERIDGRLQEFVVCRDHRLVTVTTLGAAHFEQLDRCLRIQYEQSVPGELILRVVAMRPLDDQAKREIEAAVRDKTQGGCTVRVEEADEIALTARGKQRLLLQHLDVSRYLGAAMDSAISFVPDARSGASSPSAAAAETLPLRQPSPSLKLPAGQSVLMLGTDPRTRGGIAAVINTYRTGGLFDRVPVTLVSTHQDGHRGQKALRFMSAVGVVLREFLMRRTALVHAHVSSRASFWRKSLLLQIARWFGVPTVFHLHSGGFGEWTSQPGFGADLRRWWVRRTLESSDAVIVLSKSWARWMKDFAPLSRITVVGNPVQVPLDAPGDGERGSNNGAGRVLFLGWIYDFKGVYDLLQSWVLFRQRCPGWRLVVGGKGEVDEFLAAADELGVREDLDFLGWVAGEDKERELRRADIFVLPSYREGMPVSVLEAMAFGAAVATTPVGGVPDMMEPGVHGLWMEPGDIQGIADRMVELARSPELRRSLSSAAFARVLANNSVEASITPLLSTYGRLIRPD